MKRRIPLVAGLILAGGVARAQTPLPEKLTYEGRAETMGRLLKRWSDTTGTKFECVPGLGSEVVLVSVRDQPFAAVMAHVAKVVEGKWERSAAGTYRLVIDPAARKARDREAIAKRTAKLKGTLALSIKVFAPSAEPSKESPEGESGEAALIRIISGLDLSLIAQMGPNDRLVWSTAPTAMQRALPNSANAYLAAWVEQHNRKVASEATAEVSPEMESYLALIPAPLREKMEREKRPIKEFAKAILVVSPRSPTEMMQATVQLYDQSGATVGSTDVNLDKEFLEIMSEQYDERKGAKKTDPGEMVKYSPLAQAVISAQPQYTNGTVSEGTELTAAVQAQLRNVVENDPLSLMLTDELLALAAKQGKPIVANLSDETSGLLSVGHVAARSVAKVQSDLAAGKLHEIVPDPTFLLVRPADSITSRAVRTDRAALQKLISASTSSTRLKDLATFASVSPDVRNISVVSLYLEQFVPGSGTIGIGRTADWNLLRLYNRIESSFAQRLMDGEAIPISYFDTNPVAAMVYGPSLRLRFDRGVPPSRFEFFGATIGGMMGSAGGVDYRDEPTEAMPRGLPTDATVSVKVSKEPYLSVVGSPGSLGMSSAGLDDIALLHYMLESKEMGDEVRNSMPKIPTLKQGERTVYAFTINFGSGYTIRESLTDDVLPPDAQSVDLMHLPPGLQQLVAERIEEIKKSPIASMLGMLGSMMSRKTPPPPLSRS